MAADNPLTKYQDIPCCPDLDTSPSCDIIDFRRTLVFPTNVRTPQGQTVRVEVTIHTRYSRCSGPLALGDIAYSTTLLPGEKVRLATTDRRSRFSFDSESQLSYRSEQISEEQYMLRSMRAFMSDENVQDSGSSHYSEEGKWDFHGDATGSIGWFSASASTNAKGSHNASSASDYINSHRAHAVMSDNQAVEATRKAHSISIGEVSTRTHSEGQSEDHFEASSREFSNPNKCNAVTFLFYRINKIQKIKFELVAIERRVLDPVAAMPVPANPFRPTGDVGTLPQEVPATSGKRLELQTASIQAAQQFRGLSFGTSANVAGAQLFVPTSFVPTAPDLGTEIPLSDDVRAAALAQVDADLQKQGLLTRAGEPTRQIKRWSTSSAIHLSQQQG